MLLYGMVSLASLIASALAGGDQRASLICSGAQLIYRDDVGPAGAPLKTNLPWSRSYTLYLKDQHYCESRCRPDASLDESDNTRLVLGDLEYGPQSTRLTYAEADGSIQGRQVVQLTGATTLHVETSGTCKLSPGPAPPVPASP